MNASKVGGVWTFEVGGVTLVGVEAAAEHFGINLFTLRGRIAKGWTILQCLGLEPKPEIKTSAKAIKERWKHKKEVHEEEASTKTRVCRNCKTRKAFSEYSAHPTAKHGISTLCRSCLQERSMKSRYGIGVAEYDSMLLRQGGVCDICGDDNPQTKGKRFCIDHCHKTGKVRGLLCLNCNLAIGKMNDDPERIVSAINYLRQSNRRSPSG